MTSAPYQSSQRLIRGPRSLSGRMLLALLSAHLVLAPLLVIFVLNTAAQNYKDRFIDQARSDAQWIQSLLETLPSAVDRQALLDDLVLNVFRQSVQLFDTRNIRLAGASVSLDSPIDNLREDFEFGQHGDSLYWITLPLHNPEDNTLHIIKLAYDESPIAQDVTKLYNYSLQLAALYLALIIAATAGFSRYLSSSLNKLRTAAHHIATGHYEEQFPPHNGATEIVALSNDLEHMRKELVDRGQRLDEQSQYLRTLLDHIVEGVVTFNPQGIIETCNPAGLTLFTCSSRIPDKARITDWLPDLRIPVEPDAFHYPVAQPYLGQQQDGGFITVELTMSAVKHEDQYRYLALIRDISERKRIEAERRKQRDELTHARRLSSLGEMAAGLAHELNQPLAAINLYIQGALKRLEDYSTCPPDIKTAIEKASLQAQRAGDIISQIRTFVKKASPKLKETDINRLTGETVQLLEMELASVKVDLDLDESLPVLTVDRLQIQQVLINLISNALDAMGTVPPEDKQLTIRTRCVDTTITIAVEDCGRGVSDEIADQLFTPFASDRDAGVGLGLAISRTISEEHNGTLDFHKRVGGGTVFTITLPVASYD